MSVVLMFALKALIASGALATAGAFIANKIPAFNVHTGSVKLDSIIDTVGDACEGVVKTMLHGPLLGDVIKAAVAGQNIAGPLAAQLPELRTAVLEQIGPAVQAALAAALGGTAAADKRLTTEILVATREHALATVQVLASGAKLVVPAA